MRFLERHSLPVEVARSFARICVLLEASHMKEGNVVVYARRGRTSRPELTAPARHDPAIAIPVCEQVATGTTDGPATAQAPDPVPDEAMQNNSDQPAPECCDTPMEEQVGDVSGMPGEDEVLELSESSEENDARIHELLEASHMKEDYVTVEARGGGTSRPELTAPHPPATPACEQAATGTTDGPGTVEAPEQAPEWSESSEDDEDERGQEGRKRCGGVLRRSNRRCVQAKRFRHRGGKGSVASDPIEL